MAQPSVANYYSHRKRSALEDSQLNKARKVLILDLDETTATDSTPALRLDGDKAIIFTQDPAKDVVEEEEEEDKSVGREEKSQETEVSNRIVALNRGQESETPGRKVLRASRSKRVKSASNNHNIQDLFSNLSKPQTVVTESAEEEDVYKTPPCSPAKRQNALDKMRLEGPSLKEIKNKMSRSARLSQLKASMARFNEGAKKLAEIEKKTAQISDSPKLKEFKTIQLEVQTSPQKVFSPEKAYLSPRKEAPLARKNLFNLLSPTKNALPIPADRPSKEILSETSKPALTLPFKYRFLAEMFRAADTVCQIMYNRKETITFKKLKPAVEEMLKRNLLEKHLGQINTLYPEAYTFCQEKLKVFGGGLRAEQWELVLKPQIKDGGNMTSEILLERRRKLFNTLLDKVKTLHEEFLMNLETPLRIPKDKVTRWHPEFDLEKIPDIEPSPLPQPPVEDQLTSGKEVLERARVLFSCNNRMELALQKLKEKREEKAKETQTSGTETVTNPEPPQSILKGIPKALLERVRQKQAAKALMSMTRSSDKEKEVQLYSRLPEIARLTRNVFVAEKKGVLPLETVVDKLENCYRGNLTRPEMEEHLKVVAKELPDWLQFHDIRNCVYVKLNKSSDVSLVLHKLEGLCKLKNET